MRNNFRCNINELKGAIDVVAQQLLNKRKTIISSAERDKKACEYAQKKGSAVIWQEYLRQFPKGICAFVARLSIKNSPSDATIEKSHYKLYKRGSDMLIKDRNTKLIWQYDISSKSMTWEEGHQYCSNLEEGGYVNWRMPTIKELQYHIKDCLVTKGSCASYQGPGEKGFYWEKGVWSYRGDNFGVFWTSTKRSGNISAAKVVSFYNGLIYETEQSFSNYVMCVR